MAEIYITDMTHYLDDIGDIAVEGRTGLKFVKHLTSIIAMISHPTPVPEAFKVKCRRKPNRKPCKGVVQGIIESDTGVIIWWCPECNVNGFISNWQGTIWDLRDADGTAH